MHGVIHEDSLKIVEMRAILKSGVKHCPAGIPHYWNLSYFGIANILNIISRHKHAITFKCEVMIKT